VNPVKRSAGEEKKETRKTSRSRKKSKRKSIWEWGVGSRTEVRGGKSPNGERSGGTEIA